MLVQIVLFKNNEVRVSIEGDNDATEFRLMRLVRWQRNAATWKEVEAFAFAEVWHIPRALEIIGNFAGGDADEFSFKGSDQAPLGVSFSSDLGFAGQAVFFGKKFDVKESLAATLTINIPAPNTAASADTPFMSLTACGRFAIDAGGAKFSAEILCFEVALLQLPPAFPSTARPSFAVKLPDFGIDFPALQLPWQFPQFPDLPFRLPAFDVSGDAFPLSVSWKAIGVEISETEIAIHVQGLRVASKFGAIEGDLHLFITGGAIDTKRTVFELYLPDFQHRRPLPIKQWLVTEQCLSLQWTEPQLNAWLGLLNPDLAALDVDENVLVSLRLLRDGSSFAEMRLDWTPAPAAPAAPNKYRLPGFDIEIPAISFYSLVLEQDVQAAVSLSLILTADANRMFAARSTFTFARQDARELHHTPERNTDTPLISLSATTRTPVSLALVTLPLSNGGPPKFFQELLGAVTPLAFDPQNENSFKPTDTARQHLTSDNWTAQLALNLPAAKRFLLPFLNKDSETGGGENLGQALSITGSRISDPNFNEHNVGCSLDLALSLGNAQLTTAVEIKFDWESFAFSLDDTAGLTFSHKGLLKQEFLGLTWIFSPNDKDELFKLVTADSNYQLKQAPGSRFEVWFTRATSEEQPVIFSLTDFVLTPGGVSVNGKVTDSPVRLNGINEQFRFTEGSFQIRDNHLTDFTISGSGPLPPALVGNATASISLQFGQRDGRMELIAGTAQLRGTKLLKCQGTRFQFSVDGIGLKFVNDGKYHLYFTITGMARFVPLESDDPSGPLAWLPAIELQLIECPLAGDARVIARHIKFLVELPKKATFEFLGCFKMELRGIGFVPQATMFDDGASAMELSGQLKFAEGDGDVLDARIDFHSLFIGLPAPGSLVPRIHLKDLGIKVKSGDAFELEGVVDFIDGEIEPGITAKGFSGEGTIAIQGLPTIAASFSFIRASRDGGRTWVRAWFLYIEARKLSLMIPVIEVYIREIGFGFGYRYTLASIKVADELDDPRKLIQELTRLSRTQGQLAHRDQWRVDIEPEGQSARWTVALRAMISQTTAAGSPLDWNAAAEKDLPSVFVMDVVIGLRSDLTFLMTGRAWLNTNYNDYLTDVKGLQSKPLMSGFLLLSPRRKRLLAHLASNQGAEFGDHPPLPSFLKQAIAESQFSATLLIEPGLLHYEMGWPNMLRWHAKLGPLEAEFRGGTIFRLSRRELVIGNSFLARGSLQLSAELNLGFVGARLSATANVAYGARYIGVIGFDSPASRSALYGAIGVEIHVDVRIDFWLKIELTFVTIRLDFHFSFTINFTAFLEVGVTVGDFIGARGTATVCLGIMGHDLRFGIHVGINEGAVEVARRITEQYLHIGLEATEVEPIPGSNQTSLAPAPPHALAAPVENAQAVPGDDDAGGAAPLAAPAEVPQPSEAVAADPDPVLTNPDYSIFSIPVGPPEKGDRYFILLPSAEKDPVTGKTGFLPVSPNSGVNVVSDFIWTLPTIDGIEHFKPTAAAGNAGSWVGTKLAEDWKVNWDREIGDGNYQDGRSKQPGNTERITLGSIILNAFKTKPRSGAASTIHDLVLDGEGDPEVIDIGELRLEDERVHHPSDGAFEAAVRGAQVQFEGSPYFKRDPNSDYENRLSDAFSPDTTIYGTNGKETKDSGRIQQAIEMRSVIVKQLIEELQAYVAAGDDTNQQQRIQTQSLAFNLGLVFRTRKGAPPWLTKPDVAGEIVQRRQRSKDQPDSQKAKVRPFNTSATSFDSVVPQFQRVRQYTDANTIAITWDLVWPADQTFATGLSSRQKDPEHNLRHYLVRRRPLAGGEREVEYTIKHVEVLNRTSENAVDVIQRLKPRFQIVDHFNEETAEDQAALPAGGKSYLYSIIPVDVAGTRSNRPLTVIATRHANVPPPVPADGELIVKYKLDPDIFDSGFTATVLQPQDIFAQWTPPAARQHDLQVAVAERQLIFRKEPTVPVGSFGLDSDSGAARSAGLPTSNARVLRTDIVVPLPASAQRAADPKKEAFTVKLDSNVLPKDGWRPESWRVFLQTKSNRGVLSALTPVAIVLQFTSGTAKGETDFVERRPAQLEWITKPLRFKVLPPEDETADAGFARVPMPSVGEAPGELSGEKLTASFNYNLHPDRLRCIRFQWNQGPSQSDAHPLMLHAGYQLYEFDLDAHTAATLDNPPADFWEKLRLAQKMEILTREGQLLTPGNTLAANQWEAWYPSTVQRLQHPPADKRSETKLSPWYSWRDSYLKWPEDASLRQPESNDAVLGSFAGFAEILVETQQLKYDPPDGDATALQAFLDALAKLRIDISKPELAHLRYVRISGAINPGDNGIKRLVAVDVATRTLTFAKDSFSKPPQPITDFRVVEGRMVIDPKEKTITSSDPNVPSLEMFSSGQLVKISKAANPGNNGLKRIIPTPPGRLPAKNGLYCEGLQKDETTRIRIDTVAITVDASPFKLLHPFLEQLIELLGRERAGTDSGGNPASVTVDLSPPPPVQPGDLKTLFRNTSPDNDPYGWNVLKRMGLSITFCLRNGATGELLPSTDAHNIFNRVLAGLATAEYAPHLYVEFLFQPARSMRLPDEPDGWSTDDLLALFQVSLRPQVARTYRYARLKLGIDKRIKIKAVISKTASTLTLTEGAADLSVFSGALYVDIDGATGANNGLKKLKKAEAMTLTFEAPEFESDEGPIAVTLTSVAADNSLNGVFKIDKAASTLTSDSDKFAGVKTPSYVEITGAREAGNNGCRQVATVESKKLTLSPGSFAADEADAPLTIIRLTADKTVTAKLKIDKSTCAIVADFDLPSAFGAASFVVVTGAKNAANNGPKQIVKAEIRQLSFASGSFAADETDVSLTLTSLIRKRIDVRRSGEKIRLQIDTGKTACTLVEQTGVHASIDLPATSGPSGKSEFELQATVPTTGAVVLLFRSTDPHTITVNGEGPEEFPAGELGDLLWSLPFFPVPRSEWKKKFVGDVVEDAVVKDGWETFKRYLLRINPADPASAGGPKIEFPRITNDASSDDESLGLLFDWLDRFFAASGSIMANSPGVQTLSGPWFAAAYPRIASPVGVVPDASGRLKFYQPVADQWAHVYRYYIQPHSRYDSLWESLAQSKILYPAPAGGVSVIQQGPDPKVANLQALRRLDFPGLGGLDVVLDRIKSVSQPVVLFSGRLDLKTAPAVAAPPGKTWEVIVAKHPEQILSERNRTLVRHLSYRHVAHTLLRRFAFTKSLESLRRIMKDVYDFEILDVENLSPPDKFDDYAAPEHLNLKQLDDDSLRSLEIPERIGTFGKGALVLQWEALPFFYEHRLLLVAQTSHCVSDVTDIIQRDFEYLAPTPAATIEGSQSASDPFRALTLRITLGSYWQSLPNVVTERWPIEQWPKDVGERETYGKTKVRKLSSLPDTDVTYQLALASTTGAKETLLEFFFEGEPRPGDDLQKWSGYRPRILDPKFTGEVVRITPPEGKDPAFNPFQLQTRVFWTSKVKLATRPGIPDRVLDVRGDFTRALRNAQLIDAVPEFAFLPDKPRPNAPPEAVDAFLQSWFAVRAVSVDKPLDTLPNLKERVDFFGPLATWRGEPSDVLLKALDDWAKASSPDVAAVILDLKAQVTSGNHDVTRVLPDTVKVPDALATRVSIGRFLMRLRAPLLRIKDKPAGVKDELDQLQDLYPNAADKKSIENLANDLDDRQALESFLATWASEEPIGTRNSFPASKEWNDRIEFPAPMSCALVLNQRLTADESLALTQLAESSDISFATAIRRLLEQASEVPPGATTLTIVAEAGVGFEQLLEIAHESQVVLPTSIKPKLQWLGSINEAQHLVLSRWVSVSSFGQTFNALLGAIDKIEVKFPFDDTKPWPAKNFPPVLRRPAGPASGAPQRLRKVNGDLVWTGLLLRPEETAALKFLALDKDYDESVRQAVSNLIAALKLPVSASSASVTVAVKELDWSPRPAIVPAVKDKLLIGNGRVRFYGWMGRDEAEALRKNQFAADREAVARLFQNSLKAGLAGGTLWIKARRGSAQPKATEIKLTL